LPTALLVQTAHALALPGDRAVLGPCADGGYYLLGVKRAHARLFDDITWSTEVVYEQTLQRLAELQLETVLLEAWYDVDEAAALHTLAGETLGGEPYRRGGPAAFAAPHASAALVQLLSSGDGAQRLARQPEQRRAAGLGLRMSQS
jgi:hypothetical protein